MPQSSAAKTLGLVRRVSSDQASWKCWRRSRCTLRKPELNFTGRECVSKVDNSSSSSVYNRLIPIWEKTLHRFLATAHQKDHCREITRKRKKYPASLCPDIGGALWKTSICTCCRAIPFWF